MTYKLKYPIFEIKDDSHIKIKSNGSLLQAIVLSILYTLMILVFGYAFYVNAGMFLSVLIILFIAFGWVITFKYFLHSKYFLIDVVNSVLVREPILGKQIEDVFDISLLRIRKSKIRSNFNSISLVYGKTYKEKSLHYQSHWVKDKYKEAALETTYEFILSIVSDALKYKNAKKANDIALSKINEYAKAFPELKPEPLRRRITKFLISIFLCLIGIPIILFVLLMVKVLAQSVIF
ncbi:hypothetical protein [Endozoicomonas sp. 2B-B]